MRSTVMRVRAGAVALAMAGALTSVGTACAGPSNDAVTAGPSGTPGTPGSDAVAVAECTRPMTTGTADADHYAGSLDEMVTASDVVIEGRVTGAAGPAIVQGEIGMNAVQPMAVAVTHTFRGDPGGGEITVRRLETRFGYTGSTELHAGAWAGEPWYCPGESYLLFLDRQADGTYLALSRVGAVQLEPRPDAQTVATGALTPPLPSLVAMSPEELRRQVEAAVERAGSSGTTAP